MLVLTRRPSETIILETPEGDHIQATVLAVKGNHARIGIEAPEGVIVLREELIHETAIG